MREAVPMDKSTPKAREIEALTFMFTPDAPRRAAASTSVRGGWFRRRPATVGLTAALVVMGALAWVIYSVY
jgi:hypothetical protein